MPKASAQPRPPTAPLRHFVNGAVLGLFGPILVMVGLLSVVWSLEQVTQDDPRGSQIR